MTEIIDKNVSNTNGVIFFDAACGPCSASARRLNRIVGKRGFVFLPLQDPSATELTHLTPDELRREMTLRLRDGRVLGGIDAVLHLARRVFWARPLAWLGDTRWLRPILERAYARFARNRSRLSRACPINHRDRCAWVRWLLSITLLITACALRPLVAPWVAMWIIAVTIFASLKLWTWWPLRSQAATAQSFAYLFACATLDAKRFFSTSKPSADETHEKIASIVYALVGATLVWGIARLISANHPLLIGWTGMIGLVLMLHFGLLQLISISWQRAGIDAALVMNKPLSFISLADFWSRWNRPFTTFAFDQIFRPLRRFSVALATLATFLFSGVVHDLAISVPAGAGFGRPTLYFLIQGIAILIERKLNLHATCRSHFAAVVLVAPIALLFHPPFIHNVILPMLSAMHALGKELP
jgi:alginate O-acetyltransferase complex protein AlgI